MEVRTPDERHSINEVEINHLRSIVKDAEETTHRYEILIASLKSLNLLLESKDVLISHFQNCDHCISGQQAWLCESAMAFLTDHDRLVRATEEAVTFLKEQTNEPKPLDFTGKT